MRAVAKARSWASSVAPRDVAMGARRVFGSPPGGAGFYGNQSFRWQQITEGYRAWSFIAIRAYMDEIAGGDPPEIGRVVRKDERVDHEMRLKRKAGGLNDHGWRELRAWEKRKAWGARNWVKKSLAIPEDHEFEAYDHDDPICKPFHNPNGPDVAYDLWAYTVLFHKLCGYVVLWVKRNSFGMPEEIWPIPTHWIQQLVSDQDGEPVGWLVMNPWGRSQLFPFDECVVLQDHSPLSRWEGYAVNIAIADWLDTYESLVRSRLSQFKNGAVPNVHVALGETYSDPDEAFLARFYAKWFSRFQGEDKAGLPIVTGPDIEIKTLGNLPPELFLAGDESISTNVLAAYKVPKGVVGVEPAADTCHDEQTECLTAAGWVRYDQITEQTRVACYDATTEKIVYRKPTRIIKVDYDGPMHRWQSVNAGIDALMTPKHKAWLRNPLPRGTKRKNTNPWGPWQKREVGTLAKSQVYRIITSAEAACAEPGFIFLEAQKRGTGNTGPKIREDAYVDPMDWCQFLGWFISEGCVTIRRDKQGFLRSRINISQSLQKCEERGYGEEIDSCFKSLGVDFRKRLAVKTTEDTCDLWNWDCDDYGLALHLREHCGERSESRKVPSYVKDWPAEYLKAILEGLVSGDGSRCSDRAWQFYTSSKQLADDAQELATKAGWRSSIVQREQTDRDIKGRPLPDSIGWYVNILVDADERVVLPNHRSVEHYKGVVWCLEVPTGLFVTRRNGCTLISSNSAYAPLAQFARYAINPMLTYYGQVMSEKIMRRTKGYEDGVLHWKTRIPNDPMQINADAALDGQYGAITPNEIRMLRGRPAYEFGGDDPTLDAKAMVNWGTGVKLDPDQVLDMEIGQQLTGEAAETTAGAGGSGLGAENTNGAGAAPPSAVQQRLALSSTSGASGGYLVEDRSTINRMALQGRKLAKAANGYLPRWQRVLNGVH